MASEIRGVGAWLSRRFAPAATALIAIGMAGPLASPHAARAHAIESSLVRLQALHDTLQLDIHFSSGMPVDGAVVRLVSPDGKQSLDLGLTDHRGALRFQLPSTARSNWEVQVDGGGGHRDYLELPVAATRAPQARSAERGVELPWGLMVLGMVSGGWVWIRRRR
jgi:hypothetical protein